MPTLNTRERNAMDMAIKVLERSLAAEITKLTQLYLDLGREVFAQRQRESGLLPKKRIPKKPTPEQSTRAIRDALPKAE